MPSYNVVCDWKTINYLVVVVFFAGNVEEVIPLDGMLRLGATASPNREVLGESTKRAEQCRARRRGPPRIDGILENRQLERAVLALSHTSTVAKRQEKNARRSMMMMMMVVVTGSMRGGYCSCCNCHCSLCLEPRGATGRASCEEAAARGEHVLLGMSDNQFSDNNGLRKNVLGRSAESN
ncbi:unnamed protein product [Caenorhabditis bovis]|uniref:Uncharacterized protein n=1 Tax=Caenorhabditis bovis TaxID=2654633 RepID=A0A8S1EZA0_9PELO|nr:unnamed protein product [Caenorhabditis bovis]